MYIVQCLSCTLLYSTLSTLHSIVFNLHSTLCRLCSVECAMLSPAKQAVAVPGIKVLWYYGHNTRSVHSGELQTCRRGFGKPPTWKLGQTWKIGFRALRHTNNVVAQFWLLVIICFIYFKTPSPPFEMLCFIMAWTFILEASLRDNILRNKLKFHSGSKKFRSKNTQKYACSFFCI